MLSAYHFVMPGEQLDASRHLNCWYCYRVVDKKKKKKARHSNSSLMNYTVLGLAFQCGTIKKSSKQDECSSDCVGLINQLFLILLPSFLFFTPCFHACLGNHVAWLLSNPFSIKKVVCLCKLVENWVISLSHYLHAPCKNQKATNLLTSTVLSV